MKKKGIDSPPPLPKPETVSDDAVRLEEKEQEEIDARIKAARIREAKMDNIRLRMKIVQESKLLTQNEIEEQTHELEQELERLEAAGVEPTPPQEEEPPPAGDAEKLPPKQEEAAELANDGEKGTSLENRRKFLDVMARVQERFGRADSPKIEERGSPEDHLAGRLKELGAEAKKIEGIEKLFRSLGERYNEYGWKTKLAVGVGLGLGAGIVSSVSFAGVMACLSGVAVQRIAGMASMFLKYEKSTSDEKWLGLGKREKAMGKAMLYTAGMTGAMLVLVEGVKEGVAYAHQHQWGERVHEWLGHMFGHDIAPAMPETPQPAAAAAAGEAAATHAPEMPTVGASPGRGYEDMVERLWKELQGKNLDPNQYPPNSDIHRLLTADAHTIDKVVHDLASDKGGHRFFHEMSGTNVRIDPSAHLTIVDGQLHFSDATHPDMVNAAGDMRVTPAYHPEAPVPAASATAPAPAEAVSPPAPHATAESAAQPAAPETRAPVIEHGFIVNKFDVTIPVYEPHIYADAGAKHLLVYGGSPLERANAIQEYLTKNPNAVVFSADDSGKYRIPWHLVGGKATPGMPEETRGFLGFFKSFMKAPGPDEFAKLVQ